MRRVFTLLVSAVFVVLVVSLVAVWCAVDSSFDSPSLMREARRYAEEATKGGRYISADEIIAARFAEYAARRGDVSVLLDYLEKEPREIYKYRDKIARLVCNQDAPEIIRRGLKLAKTVQNLAVAEEIFTDIAAECFEREDFLAVLREYVDSSAKERKMRLVLRIADCRKARGDESVFRPRRSSFQISRENYLYLRRNGFVVSDLMWEWHHDHVQGELDRFFVLMSERKDTEAKLLFDEMVSTIKSLEPMAWSGRIILGMPEASLCGMAVIAIELGKPDWARELCPKIVIPLRGDPDYQFVIDLRMGIAEVYLALGEPQKAWKTLAGIGDVDIPFTFAPLPCCDIAVILAQSGDRESAADILRKVAGTLDALEQHVRYEDVAQGVLEAAQKIGDATLGQEIVERVLDCTSRRTSSLYRSTRPKIFAMCVVAECALGNIDAAKKIFREHFFGHDVDSTDRAVFAVVDALVLQKRYDEAAAFPDQQSEWATELANSDQHRHPNIVRYFVQSFQNPHRTASVACRVARAQCADGDSEAALRTLKKAVLHIRQMNHRDPKNNADAFADIAIEIDAINKRR